VYYCPLNDLIPSSGKFGIKAKNKIKQIFF
jgi:hypothetical protein